MAEKEAAKKEEKKEAPEEKPKKKKGDDDEAPAGPKRIMGMSIPVLGLSVLNLLVVLGGFGYIYYVKMVYKPPVITEDASKTKIKLEAEKEEKAKVSAEGVVRIITLPEMNINLRSKVGGRNHYATITLAMKCNNDVCMEEMKALRAKIEDTVQTLISARSYSELTMSEASFRLKHEITKNVNMLLKHGTITDTYFSDYTVQ